MEAARRGLVLIVVSAVSYGGVAVLAKLVLATGLGVFALSFWRWLIALAALAPVVLLAGKGLDRRTALAALALGALGQFATSGIYTASLRTIPAALASFLLFLSPVFVALMAVPLLGESLARRGVAALALALGGLALLALAPGVEPEPWGVALALASAVAYAATIVGARRLTGGADPLAVAVMLMVGAVGAFGAASAATGTLALPAAPAWMPLLLLGVVSTALSVATFYLALPLIGAPRAALVSTLEPVSTAFVAYAVLGEVLSLVQVGGAGLVLLSVALLARGERPEGVPA